MRAIVIGLLFVLLGLQYKLWFGDDSLPAWFQSDKKLNQQMLDNQALEARNHALEADIAELKRGDQALEEQARHELGMVKEGETYYHFVN